MRDDTGRYVNSDPYGQHELEQIEADKAAMDSEAYGSDVAGSKVSDSQMARETGSTGCPVQGSAGTLRLQAGCR